MKSPMRDNFTEDVGGKVISFLPTLVGAMTGMTTLTAGGKDGLVLLIHDDETSRNGLSLAAETNNIRPGESMVNDKKKSYETSCSHASTQWLHLSCASFTKKVNPNQVVR